MTEIFPDTADTLYYSGCRYQELSTEEVRSLPEETEIYVAELYGGKIEEVRSTMVSFNCPDGVSKRVPIGILDSLEIIFMRMDFRVL